MAESILLACMLGYFGALCAVVSYFLLATWWPIFRLGTKPPRGVGRRPRPGAIFWVF